MVIKNEFEENNGNGGPGFRAKREICLFYNPAAAVIPSEARELTKARQRMPVAESFLHS